MQFDGINNFTVYDDNEQEVECEVITTFYCEATDGHYVVFTSGDTDEEGNVMIEVSKYDPHSEEMELLAINDDQEQNIVGAMLDRILEIDVEDAGEFEPVEDEE